MMAWLELLLAITAVAGIILVPGIVVAAAAGLRGLWMLGAAVPFGLSIVAMAATVAPFIGVQWSLIPVAFTAVLVLAIVVGLRRWLWPNVVLSQPRALGRAATLALVAAPMVIVIQLVIVIGTPDAISQTFDNIFHLNAVRFALDTGNASPLHLGNMTSSHTGGVPFYPSAWHAIGSLVVQVTGVSIPVASNAMMFFFASMGAVSAIVLATALFGSSAPFIVCAAAVATALPSFPLLLIDYGVLYPYMLSLSVLATGVAFAYLAIMKEGRARWAFGVGAAGVVPGIAIAHPGGLMAFLIFVTMIVAIRYAMFFRVSASSRAKRWSVLAAVGYAIVFWVVWSRARPPADARSWVIEQSLGQAVGEIATVAPMRGAINLVVAILVTVGIVVAVRRRSSTDVVALGLFVVAAGLYVVVTALPYPIFRDMVTGPWYNNAPRIAALLPLAWVPLAGLGGAALWSWMRQAVKRRGETLALRVALVFVAILGLVVLPQRFAVRPAVTFAHHTYEISEDSAVLSLDEKKLLERLPQHVAADAVIVGNAWTGTALAYAYSGREVLLPHTLTDVTSEMQQILDGLGSATVAEPACIAARDLGVTFVLDFGRQEVHGGRHFYPGLASLARSETVEMIDSEGDAKLYAVVGCGSEK